MLATKYKFLTQEINLKNKTKFFMKKETKFL